MLSFDTAFVIMVGSFSGFDKPFVIGVVSFFGFATPFVIGVTVFLGDTSPLTKENFIIHLEFIDFYKVKVLM